ncbi:protoheme IX farnesyltransferase [Motilibacter peucedani]|uniref:Protoheme IX farnesyltransferase n=1 Tax=Motilibacter peucedani TaxID=598650 RepID=A0A420XVR6_9ACTN|nr:heme o synthase [Motilibacter peucedani]RKS84202.1 protoheme IX farnesyltransferase [Motilibacter peucedani]
MTAVDPRPAITPSPGASGDGRPSRSPAAVAKAYLALTKPRIIELLLCTTIPTMVLAADGLPGLLVTVATLVGGFLAAGSANALNCYIDRDIDAVMHRTEGRPLATGAVSPREALLFGLALGAASVVLFATVVNWLSAALSVLAIAFYVLVYTLVLKRRTAQNIVWGGAAGCMPVLIGWAAVTGSLSWAPVVLFAVVFLWTPPHYWPLAMRFRDDYATAGVPMLPVVATEAVVAGQVVVYSWAMVAASLLLWPVASMGWVYGALALVLGAAFLREAHALQARARAGVRGAALKPMRLFHGSISYLSLLFLAVAIDPLLR